MHAGFDLFFFFVFFYFIGVYRSFTDDSLFPGRRLAELMVELNSLLNSDDIRLFETDM